MNYLPEYPLWDIQTKVPMIFVMIATLMVFTMKNKWHWFLFIPLAVCMIGVLRLNSRAIPNNEQLHIIDTILTVVLAVMIISVILSHNPTGTLEVVLCGISIFLMALVAFVIVFLVSSIKNIYTQILFLLFVLCMFIISFTFVSINDPTLRRNLYIGATSMTFFFIVYYIASLNARNFNILRQFMKTEIPNTQKFMDIRQLPNTNTKTKARTL